MDKRILDLLLQNKCPKCEKKLETFETAGAIYNYCIERHFTERLRKDGNRHTFSSTDKS